MSRNDQRQLAGCLTKAWWFDAVRAGAAADRMRARHGMGCHCLVYVCPMGAQTRGENHLHIGHLKGDKCKRRQDKQPEYSTRWLVQMTEEEAWHSRMLH
jgi:hypothetical protein